MRICSSPRAVKRVVRERALGAFAHYPGPLAFRSRLIRAMIGLHK